MFVVCYGNIVDGMSFVGPFVSHDDAVLHCDGDDSQWNIVELVAPPDATAGSLSVHLQEFADQLDEIAIALDGPLIGPSEETAQYVKNLRAAEEALRTI